MADDPKQPARKVAKKVAPKKAAAKKAAPKTGGTKGQGYRVTVKQDGFRRAGRAWSGTTETAPGELTQAQIKQLRADPMFEVEPR